ncbi:MAG: PAS domain S-box protein, partial [Chitinophagia bacterium]|nr:PAS domain S-box protein [Chitinophagia bacterium]
IRESEYRLKLVLEAANVGWWDWDIDNNITYFDPKWWAMIGYQPEQQLISPNYKEYFNNLPIHPNDVERVIKTYKTAIDGDASKYEFEYRIQHKQGHYVPVLARGYILRNQNGKPIRISGTNMDLTEIKLVEQAFHQSQDNLRTVFENTTVGYILFDTHLQILSFNGPAAHFTLSEHGKPLVAGNSFLSYFPEEQHERIMGVALKVLSGEKLEHETLHNATGEDNWYYVKYSPVANKNSEVVGFVLAMENITDRKKQELEKATSFKLLSEQNKRLLGFSYIVSHNLRSHTSNIKSIVQFLKETDEQEERTEMLTHLTTVTDLLHETIHNLHDVVSVHNAVGLVNIPLNLSGYVGKAINVLGDQIEAKKALINNNVPYDVTIEYHPAYLESITLNFISNAIKYAHPDRHPVVNINYNMENNEKILIIADNGIGIDLKRNGDKLFGLYKTFHDNQDARGVGLFITKNQIESMGGRVEVESELGIGTTFKIYFK